MFPTIYEFLPFEKDKNRVPALSNTTESNPNTIAIKAPIAKVPYNSTLNPALIAKILASRHELFPLHAPEAPAPVIKHMHFSGVKRGPLCIVREFLRRYIPDRALLGLFFVKHSTLEMLMDDQMQNLAKDTADTMHLLGFQQNQSFRSEDNSCRIFCSPLSPTAYASRTKQRMLSECKAALALVRMSTQRDSIQNLFAWTF